MLKNQLDWEIKPLQFSRQNCWRIRPVSKHKLPTQSARRSINESVRDLWRHPMKWVSRNYAMVLFLFITILKIFLLSNSSCTYWGAFQFGGEFFTNRNYFEELCFYFWLLSWYLLPPYHIGKIFPLFRPRTEIHLIITSSDLLSWLECSKISIETS